jgi:hypothetical protein
MMASVNEDTMLAELSEDVDTQLLKWLTTYELPGLNLTAIILARLVWLARQGNYTDDFLRLLEAPKDIVEREEIKTQVH